MPRPIFYKKPYSDQFTSVWTTLRVFVQSGLIFCFLVSPLWAQTTTGKNPSGSTTTALPEPSTLVAKGEYLLRAAGGCSCHTDSPNKGKPMAGGRAIHTPFGTFYSTNITPDKTTGIGTWSEADFVRAMTEGVAPDGNHYFPAFPYTTFSSITRPDLSAMWAYLRSIPAVSQPNRPHDVWPPFGWRFPLPIWKWLNFSPGPFVPNKSQDERWNRGAYLVNALGHCAECHSPRNLMGGIKNGRRFSGGEHLSPEPVIAANLTTDQKTGLAGWSETDMVWLMQTGFRPNGDDVQGVMLELIEQGYQHLNQSDLEAIAYYLRTLPPQTGLPPKKGE